MLAINDMEMDDDSFASYVREGGPNKMEIDSMLGDVSIWFGISSF